MQALITGASSGIGRDMARYLSHLGYDLVIVARRQNLLEELKNELKTDIQIECLDISNVDNCKILVQKYPDIDILINNAGFGKFGEFITTDIDEEVAMIDTNVVAVQVLTKLYLQKMQEKNRGHILNVASIAGLLPGGPLMTTYYATKSYLVSMTRSILEELRIKNSDVKISVLCPGPVETNFNNVANVKFSLKGLPSEYVAHYAVDEMLKGKKIIIPGFSIKMLAILSKFSPSNFMLYMIYKRQKAKGK